jgi:hypothetical protein
VAGFLALDLYFVFIPSILGNPFLQFGAYLIFFPLAYFIAKWVGMNGLKGMGLVFHRGWLKNFIFSFWIGFSFWILMFVIQLLSGDLLWNGVRQSSELLMPLLMIIVGFFIGSFINDLIVRGFVINLLKDKLHVGWVFTISILIYALDDYWYAGFSLSNFIFSEIRIYLGRYRNSLRFKCCLWPFLWNGEQSWHLHFYHQKSRESNLTLRGTLFLHTYFNVFCCTISEQVLLPS